jgi:hypothetical protein
VSRTHGVSIFIDYCSPLAIQRKVEGKERDTGLINRTRSAAVQPGAIWCLMACARRGVLISAYNCFNLRFKIDAVVMII